MIELGRTQLAPERDGCDCQPWIVRCSHWEGCIQALVDTRVTNPHTCMHSEGVFPHRFYVFKGYGWKACSSNGCPGYINAGRDKHIYIGDSEADAIAAFEQAEREMLGREDGVL